jgi:UDP-GlcNAc:undecaprenyl-phosphate GlcNAc-1-phosphate transferase
MIAALTALSSFVLSVIFVALVLHISRKYAWFDHHDERKIHTGQVPRLGGVGFALAYLVVAAAATVIDVIPSLGFRFVPVLFALPLVLAFGVVDDFKSLRPRYKLLAQSAATIIVMAAGFTFHRIDFSSVGINLDLGLYRYPLTFFWIVGVTNALNFIDGVDGLAGGVSVFASLAYAAMFAAGGNAGAALLCVTLATAVGGFLVFNLPLPKARIFMGDGGSQFLGFTLALLPLLDDGIGQAILPLPFAAAILLIPIFDTFAAIWRRTRDGRRIDSPDKAHMHHKLLNLGLDSRGVDAVVWGLQIMLGVLVFASRRNTGLLAFAVLVSAYVLALAFFTVIHYLNRAAVAKSPNPTL